MAPIYSKVVETLVVLCTEVSHNHFGFRENKGTYACTALNDMSTSQNKCKQSFQGLGSADML